MGRRGAGAQARCGGRRRRPGRARSVRRPPRRRAGRRRVPPVARSSSGRRRGAPGRARHRSRRRGVRGGRERCDPVVGLAHPCRRPAQVVFQPEQGGSVLRIEPDPKGAPTGRQAHLVNTGAVAGHPEGDVTLGAPRGPGRVRVERAVHVQEQQRSFHGPDPARRGRRIPARGRGVGDARHSAPAIAVLVSISVVVVRSSTRGVGGTGTAPAPAPTAQQDLTRITRRGAHSRRCFSRAAPSPGGTAPAAPFTQARSCNSPRPTAADIP